LKVAVGEEQNAARRLVARQLLPGEVPHGLFVEVGALVRPDLLIEIEAMALLGSLTTGQ
jgi:enamine deaminase RidA (YjgF/YER057c/UK114 family)